MENTTSQQSGWGEYLTTLRDETQQRLDDYQTTGQEWDRSNLSELRRRLRDRQSDCDRYGLN